MRIGNGLCRSCGKPKPEIMGALCARCEQARDTFTRRPGNVRAKPSDTWPARP